MRTLLQIRFTNEMIAEARKTGQPVVTPAERARQELEKRIGSLEGPPELKPITDLISSLKMNNEPIRVLYESIGKLAIKNSAEMIANEVYKLINE